LQSPKHILVIRFSSMGDVAMTVPVLKNLLDQNTELKITIVSNAFYEPLFMGLERCYFHPAYLMESHKGFGGMYRLFKELTNLYKFDAVIDLHSVLRSQLLSIFFKISGLPIAKLDKGRSEKKALTRKEQKFFIPLTSMHERYASVFRNKAIPVQLNFDKAIYSKQEIPTALKAIFSSGKKIIGVAPFAQFEEKMYPIDKMKIVVSQLTTANYTVLLFGGGQLESDILDQWEKDIFSAFNVSGKYSFKEELSIISNLDRMVSMDSANMHLASLFNVPVISVWGATHPFAGFNGWGQSNKNIVQIDLACRPCSVFGNKPCYRGDHACMQGISEQMIYQKTVEGLNE
jgi:ADP-heptose:LPS heptosyltransferase